MALSAVPGRKKRENNQYFEVGVQGRKTGLTLPENPRDEYGIEDLDGIFSSPEKPVASRGQLRNGNITLTSSDMELAQSSIPEPTEVLTHNMRRKSKTVLPPPIARSPFKTNIGSSPRRQSSVAPLSQARRTTATPERNSSHPTPNRRLNFGLGGMDDSIARSPLRHGINRGVQRIPRPDVYDLVEEDETEEEIAAYREDELTNGINKNYVDNDADDSLRLLEDEGYAGGSNEDIEQMLPSSPSNLRIPRRRSGRISQTDLEEEATEISSNKETSKVAPPMRATKKRGKLLVANAPKPVDESFDTEEASGAGETSEEDLEEKVTTVEAAPVKRTGRPKKTKNVAAVGNDEIIEEAKQTKKSGRGTGMGNKATDASVKTNASDLIPGPKKLGRPRKHPIQDDSQLENEGPRPAKRFKKAGKAALIERNPNAKMSPPVFKKPTVPHVHGSPGKRSSPSMWASARAISRLREGTPAEDAAGMRTRSGRKIIPPLQHWAGEKAEYGRDGTMKEVRFAESIDLPVHHRRPPKAGKRRSTRAKNLDDLKTIEEEDSEDEPEEWETHCEQVIAMVKQWDPLLGAGKDEDEVELDVAYGASSYQMNLVNGANFVFAKLHSLPFFGTGILEIPPGGFKRLKNSRRMHMVFFIHTGKVEIVVGETVFTISKGGIWQVPRGNWYSIKNNGRHPSRIFFAQGCEVESNVEAIE